MLRRCRSTYLWLRQLWITRYRNEMIPYSAATWASCSLTQPATRWFIQQFFQANIRDFLLISYVWWCFTHYTSFANYISSEIIFFILSTVLSYSTRNLDSIKRNIKAPHHWSCVKGIVRWTPCITMFEYAEKTGPCLRRGNISTTKIHCYVSKNQFSPTSVKKLRKYSPKSAALGPF